MQHHDKGRKEDGIVKGCKGGRVEASSPFLKAHRPFQGVRDQIAQAQESFPG